MALKFKGTREKRAGNGTLEGMPECLAKHGLRKYWSIYNARMNVHIEAAQEAVLTRTPDYSVFPCTYMF